MRFLLAILALTLSPAFALAQTSTIAPPSVSAAGQNQLLMDQLLQARAGLGSDEGVRMAMPIWSTPDGRILALVSLGDTSSAPALPQAPQIGSAADWHLVDITSFVTGALSMRLSGNTNAYANFGHGIMLAPLYRVSLSSDCAQSSMFGAGCAKETTLADNGSVHLGTQLNAGDVDLDFNYGLSWLHFNDQPTAQRQDLGLFASIGNEALPTLMIPSYEFANVQSSGFNAQGRWHLDDAQSLNLGAALSRIQYELPGTALPPSLNQAALSLGLNRGDFSGAIIGRVLGPSDPMTGNQHWSSIDLGVSWRSPWRGVFSVGAQNIWSSGNLPALTDPTSHEVDQAQSRVPYVQYHQDL
jgi:hypothetical protein